MRESSAKTDYYLKTIVTEQDAKSYEKGRKGKPDHGSPKKGRKGRN